MNPKIIYFFALLFSLEIFASDSSTSSSEDDDVIKIIIKKYKRQNGSLNFLEIIKNEKDICAVLESVNDYNKLIDFTEMDENGDNAFHLAIIYFNNFLLLQKLYKYECDINLINKNGQSPLYLALTREVCDQNCIWVMLNQKALLYPQSNDKDLMDYLTIYRLLYEKLPDKADLLINKSIKNELTSNDENILKKLMRNMKLEERPFIRMLMDFIINGFQIIVINDV